MFKSPVTFLLFVFIVFFFMSPAYGAEREVLTVAAAASNAFALKEIAANFEKETGTRVRITFGSSGLLTRQIEQGAPFDVFFSANVKYIDDLKRGGFVVADSIRVYAEGRVVIAVNRASNLRVKTLEDLLSPGVKRIAIANPLHAPYGVAAMEAMKSAGVWERVKPKLVYGENVRQALRFVQTGDAPAGLVALSVADVPEVTYTIISPAAHNAIEQAVAVITASKHKSTASDFIDYVKGPAGRPVLKRSGFMLPR
ncbi:MAG: molybdate ABC transporter substrate-binding protein [Thermodesulfobacteriota bacterium]|nr:MAG: molybdate ABC transporter substrate-binding protein [Thermodesulfobacteriota bacterium]